MTQDQYGQARGPGYVVRDNAVPDDETEEFATGESKPMTRFQKVASALLGDKTDRDEADQDQAAANRVTTAPEGTTGSDGMAPNQGTPDADPSWATGQDEAAMTNSPTSQNAQGAVGTTAIRTDETAAATGAGTPRGDYWDETGAAAAHRDEAVAVTSPDVPVTDTGTEPATQPGRGDRATRPGWHGSSGDSAGHVRHHRARG